MSNMPKSFNHILSVFIFFFSVAAYAETGKNPDPASVATGKKLYQNNCQTCHQKDGVGEKEVPPALRLPGFISAMPLNATSHAWHHTDKQIVNTILNGKANTKRMPAWKGKLSESDAIHIVSYLKSLWGPKVVACQGAKHMSPNCSPKVLNTQPAQMK